MNTRFMPTREMAKIKLLKKCCYHFEDCDLPFGKGDFLIGEKIHDIIIFIFLHLELQVSYHHLCMLG